ncbi:MAG: universal stress protein [Proteobacteria bacterium]|nr:universal stress protein [Pseudomonadota bacterium]MBU1596310.1 universal stress protein [Pseudomonadota bacterium]
MFKLVLLALADKADGRAAAQVAGALAARHGAGFAVQHVSAPVGQEGGCVLQLPGEADLAARRAEVEALLREVMPPGLTADVMLGAGFAHLEILKTARILEPDLLVLGGLDETERCRRELSASQGSAAVLVADGAPCPVLVVPSAADTACGPFERVLMAVDLSGDTGRLMQQLDFAARLAAREGAELLVLHALRLPPGEPTPGHDEMVRRIAIARDRMTYLCKGLPGADRIGFIVSEGAAGVELLKHARERKADLLVVHHASPQKGAQDETLDRVLEGARCPALLLGPGALAARQQNPALAMRG